MTYFQVVPGEVIGSDHMNTAITQGAIPFPDAAARAAAIPAPKAGQLTWLASTGRYESWAGAAWVSITAQNDAWWSSLGLAGKHVQYASSTAAVSGAGGATVPFGYTFPAAPVVLAVLGDEGSPTGYIQVVNASVTVSQFAVRVFKHDGSILTSGTIRVNWIAIGTSVAGALIGGEPRADTGR